MPRQHGSPHFQSGAGLPMVGEKGPRCSRAYGGGAAELASRWPHQTRSQAWRWLRHWEGVWQGRWRWGEEDRDRSVALVAAMVRNLCAGATNAVPWKGCMGRIYLFMIGSRQYFTVYYSTLITLLCLYCLSKR